MRPHRALTLALLLVAILATGAEARKRVVVLGFAGPQAGRAQSMVEAVLGKRYTLVSAATFVRSKKKLHAGGSDRDLARVAQDVGADAVVAGNMRRKGPRWQLHVFVHDGQTGHVIGSATETMRRPTDVGGARGSVSAQIVPAVNKAGIRVVTGPACKGKRCKQPPPEDSADETPVAADDEAPPPAKGKKGRVAAADPAPTQQVDDEEDPLTGKKPKKSAGLPDKPKAPPADETPPRRASDAGDDEAPRGKKRRASDDDEAPAPRKRRASDDADADDRRRGDDDEAPRKRHKGDDRRAADDDEDSRSGRRSGDSDRDERRASDDDDRDRDHDRDRDDRDRDADTAGTLHARRSNGGMGLPGLRLSAGLSFIGRQFEFANTLTMLPSYKGTPTPAALAELEIYPAALAGGGPLRGLGFGLEFERVISMHTEDNAAPGLQIPTHRQKFEADARYRIRFGAKPSLPTALVRVGYGQHDFTINDYDPDRDGKTNRKLPNVSYHYVAIGAGLHFPLAKQLLGIDLDGAYFAVLDDGEIGKLSSFGRGTVGGAHGELALEIRPTKVLVLRIGGRYTRFFYAFDGSGTLSDQNGDGKKDVGGAVDQFYGGFVTVGFVH